jgi:hypothetical protein
MNTEKGAENKHTEIFVNARKKKWDKERISYEEVIVLAFGVYTEGENVVYSVTYTKGEHENREGSLVKGQFVNTKSGMRFDVTQTNKS